jgi:flagellar protein FlgJ
MKTTLDANNLLAAAQKTPETSQKPRDTKALKKSCQDFEALFVQSLFKAMRKTVPEGGLFEKDNATSMFEEMMDQEIATSISRKQSLGLADQIYRQMEKQLPTKK